MSLTKENEFLGGFIAKEDCCRFYWCLMMEGTDTLDSYIVSLELAYRELIVLDTTYNTIDSSQRSAVDTLRSSFVELCDLQETACHQLYFQTSSRPQCCGSVGRPRFDVPAHKFAFLTEKRFSVPQIAELLGISVRTVCRRMTDAGLSIRACYANISDRELDECMKLGRLFKRSKGHISPRQGIV